MLVLIVSGVYGEYVKANIWLKFKFRFQIFLFVVLIAFTPVIDQ
jgi:hypothetical protein